MRQPRPGRTEQQLDSAKLSTQASAATSRLRMTTIAKLSQETRAALERIAFTRTWRGGETLLRQGEIAHSLVVCDEGRLRITRHACDGSEHLSRWLGSGELVGFASVVGGQPFHATVQADGSCRTRHFPAQPLRELMRADGAVALEIASLLAQRLLEVSEIMGEESRNSLEHRLLATLQRLRKVGVGVQRMDGHEIRISQSDLAAMVDSSRQYVNPLLKRLERQGVVRLGYRAVVLLSCPAGDAQ